jgi:hypothetical protein
MAGLLVDIQSPTHRGMFFTISVFFICSAEVGLKAQNQAWYTGNYWEILGNGETGQRNRERNL